MKLPFSRNGLSLYAPLWKLDGTSFMERSAYGHRLTVSGALLYPGRGRYFDGIDDLISAPNPFGDISFKSQPITVILSLKPTTVGVWDSIFLIKPTTDTNFCIEVCFPDTGLLQVVFIRADGIGTDRVVLKNSTLISADVFTHCAFTYDGNGTPDTDTVKFYLNGNSDICQAGSLGNINPATAAVNTLFLGKFGTDNAYDGVIGENLVYSRTLSPLEVQNHYLSAKRRYA